jgi:hypothetical protein
MLTINSDKMIEFLDECRAAGVRYGWGTKVPFHGCRPGKDFTRVDCSGFIREAIWRATDPPLEFPDGSVGQHEWLKRNNFPPAALQECGLRDGALRIAFLRPEDSPRVGVGHVVLIHLGFTLESHGSSGPNRREWNGEGWQAKTQAYLLTQPTGP